MFYTPSYHNKDSNKLILSCFCLKLVSYEPFLGLERKSPLHPVLWALAASASHRFPSAPDTPDPPRFVSQRLACSSPSELPGDLRSGTLEEKQRSKTINFIAHKECAEQCMASLHTQNLEMIF